MNERKKYKKVLAICIPTYNRRGFLEENINSILSQMTPELEEKIEIDIFENASPDDTSVYCKQLVEKYDFIHYLPKSENVGPDRNFMSILAADLDAQFYHLMSDDDLFVPNSLSGLVGFLGENLNCGFVYLNVSFFWEKVYDHSLKHEMLCKRSDLTSSKLSKEQFVELVNKELSFLSGMVFNRDTVCADVEDYIGTNWLQSYALFKSTVESDGNLGFYASPVVAQRLIGETDSYDELKVFGVNYYNLFKYAYEECGYDRKQMMKLVSKSFSFLIYRAKYRGTKKEKFHELLKIAKKEGMTFVRIMSLVPSFIPKAFHAYRVKKREQK